jgi:predicted extracellular nuclease
MKTIPTSPFAAAATTPGRRTVIAAALMAGLSMPALAASPVVISQVYGGGGNSGATYKNDFIEIFNRSGDPVNVGGWSVQYASAAGSSWQATVIPAGTVLQKGQYLLIKEGAGAGGTTELPAAEATGGLALSGTTGKVALVNTSTALSGAAPAGATLVDLLGFGTAGAFEGAVGPGLSNTTAALRAGGGCSDTDNNANDFTTGEPNPRNTASALNVCGAPSAPPIVATCPANLSLAFGIDGSADLSATDSDGIVNTAAISSAAVPGISLINFLAASGVGGNATASLSVAASVQAGSYPVAITFGNDQAQQTICSISVNVAAPATLTHTIPQIQGDGDTSPYAGTLQTTEGVVTAKVGSGFFIQDQAGDGNPSSSDGMFVYTTAANTGTVQVGDKIRITGSVADYAPVAGGHAYTELTTITAIVKLGSGIAITPANIQLPHPNLGQVEGMLVRFTNPLTVSQLQYLGDRGEVTLSSGRLEIATNRYRAGTPEALALSAANALNQIVLDDGIFVTPTTIPYLGADGSLRAGDTVSDLTGVVDFGAKGGGAAGAGGRQHQGGQRQRAELLHHLHQRHRCRGQHQPGLRAGRQRRQVQLPRRRQPQRVRPPERQDRRRAEGHQRRCLWPDGDPEQRRVHRHQAGRRLERSDLSRHRPEDLPGGAETGRHRHRRDPRRDDLQAGRADPGRWRADRRRRHQQSAADGADLRRRQRREILAGGQSPEVQR